MKITDLLSTMFLCYTFTTQPASSSYCRSAPAMGTHWQYILYKIPSILGIFSDLFQHFPDFNFCYGNFTPSWFSHLKAREIIWIVIKQEWTQTGLPYKKPMKVVMEFFTEAILSTVLKILCIHWCDTGHISLSTILEFYCRQFCIQCSLPWQTFYFWSRFYNQSLVFLEKQRDQLCLGHWYFAYILDLKTV